MCFDIKNKNASKIIEEKRKRYQAYTSLDYLLNGITYFDFFSMDAFTLLKEAKYLASNLNQEFTSEFLLASYFLNESHPCFSLIEKQFAHVDFYELFLAKIFPVSTENIKERNRLLKKQALEKKKFFAKFSTPFLLKIFNKIFNKKDSYNGPRFIFHNKKDSRNTHRLFEKAAENALTRFKTPIITSEILFITMMEDKSNKVGTLIKKLFKNQMDWYLFRYKLIKIIHSQESAIRSVNKNQQYFAYLLKGQLTGVEFNRLLERKQLERGVLIFRNHLIEDVLQLNILDLLFDDVKASIKLNTMRKYSS